MEALETQLDRTEQPPRRAPTRGAAARGLPAGAGSDAERFATIALQRVAETAAWAARVDSTSDVVTRQPVLSAVRPGPERTARGRPPAETVLALQRTAGNAAFAEWAATGLAGPVSQGAPAPAPAPAPPAAPPAPPAPLLVCTISTRTLAAAPDGTPNTRTKVGANEIVEMTSTIPAHWSASAGTIVPATPGPLPSSVALWTAPLTAGPCTITATPPGGLSCTAPMTVALPTSRSLTRTSLRAYTAGQSGSGFVASVVVNPTDVSLSRLEVREEAVAGTATGYYDTVLRWNGVMHPVGTWLPLNAANGGLQDTVGTPPPGGPPPFSFGIFTWPIPQSFRAPGSGAGTTYSIGMHLQTMAVGVLGTEMTSKEGASASRTP